MENHQKPVKSLEKEKWSGFVIVSTVSSFIAKSNCEEEEKLLGMVLLTAARKAHPG